MKFDLKIYKNRKIKDNFKTTSLFIFYHTTSLNVTNWLKIDQDLFKIKLSYYRFYTNLANNAIKNSIFKGLIKLLSGPVLFVKIKKELNFPLKSFTNINPFLTFLCIRLNNRVYSLSQLKKFKNFNFFQNMIILQNFLKTILKLPYRFFRNNVI